MAEGSLATQVDKYLKSLGKDCWYFNVQGSGVQKAGVPDRIICYMGHFIGLELKRPDGKGVISPRQKIELSKIDSAGGYAIVIESVDELDSLICDIHNDKYMWDDEDYMCDYPDYGDMVAIQE